jgi:hypothetical protein
MSLENAYDAEMLSHADMYDNCDPSDFQISELYEGRTSLTVTFRGFKVCQ